MKYIILKILKLINILKSAPKTVMLGPIWLYYA